MISASVLLTILIEGGLICRQLCLLEGERLLAFLHAAKAGRSRRLESFVGLEARLEVHPVLGRVTVGFLLVRGLVADVT